MLLVAVSRGAHHRAPDTPFLVMVVILPEGHSSLATCKLMLTIHGSLRVPHRKDLSRNQIRGAWVA